MSRLRAVLPAAALLLLPACALLPDRTAQPSDFLDDYRRLVDRGPRAVGFRYQARRVDWTRYDQVLLDAARVDGARAFRPEPEPAELARLGRELRAAVTDVLARDYRVVAQGDSGTLRIDLAFSRVGDDAWLEARIRSAGNGRLLAGVVDRRAGGRTLADLEGTADWEAAIGVWAETLGRRLCAARAVGPCPPP